VTLESANNKGDEASRIDNDVEDTKGTPKDNDGNKANDPITPHCCTAPVSNKQCFPFWILLNFQLLKISQYLLINPITYSRHRKVPTTRMIRLVGLMVLLMIPRELQRMTVGTRQTIQSCHTVVQLR
jgi:hypothetical protein